MDWNGNGVLDSNKEKDGYSDPWYKALYTSWLDDWYYGGDINVECSTVGCTEDINSSDQEIIGGYTREYIGNTGQYNLVPTLSVDNGVQGQFDGYNNLRDAWEVYVDDNNNSEYDDGEDFIDTSDEFLDFDNPDYGIYNSDGVKEKGSANDRSFSSELEEMVYSLGLEYWYTDSFVFRLGYLHDQEGNLKHPTLGAGIKFGQYGFDLGYILGEEGEPRANTLLFSLNMTM